MQLSTVSICHLYISNAEPLSTHCGTQDGKGTLKVTGFLRGSCLSVNGLVHLPGFGEFQMNRIEAPSDPCPLNPKNVRRKGKKAEDGMAVVSLSVDLKFDILFDRIKLMYERT